MSVHTVKKGLDLPITGEPAESIFEGPEISRVAVIADDYVGMKPTMFVREGDKVKRGQPLFEDKKTPGVIHTSPGAGTVLAVNRGERRALQSVVVELAARERSGNPTKRECQEFEHFEGHDPAGLSKAQIRALLIESGMWTTIRTRPMSKVPAPDDEPVALFVNAMDSNPLAPPPDLIVAENEEAFAVGLLCVSKIQDGPVYLCRKHGSSITADPHLGVQIEEFSGPHPSGTVGYHIHVLEGVNRQRRVWHLGYQDVISIGKLFMDGKLHVDRVVAFAGPAVEQPRLLRTRSGASTDEITAGGLVDGEVRLISGSVLSGRTAQGDVLGYLGRYHHQVSALLEGREREFIGWLMPGENMFSILNVYLGSLVPGHKFGMTTSTNGSERAMVPIGMYEKVMPFDIIPTYLLRALIVGDLEEAEQLGCLELDEEDLGLCTFVCPGKYDYGPYLRNVLTEIDQEG